jgi:hypothetical protein
MTVLFKFDLKVDDTTANAIRSTLSGVMRLYGAELRRCTGPHT